MKRIILIIAIQVLSITAFSQNSHVIKITGTRFPYDIMRRWIQEYSSTHTGVRFQLCKEFPADSCDLQIAAHHFRKDELRDDQLAVSLNRYIQLPIVNSQRRDLNEWQKKGVTKKDLQAIYFSKEKGDQLALPAKVYRREKEVCASRSFAENVTGVQVNVWGTLVNGDDKALSAAVANDVEGISYNNLAFIYNLQTRRVEDGLAIVPMDLNENGKIDESESIYSTLDDVLNYAEKSSDGLLIEDNVNIIINQKIADKNAIDFLNWIITKGQAYNHQFGFLNLQRSEVRREQKKLEGLATTNASNQMTN